MGAMTFEQGLDCQVVSEETALLKGVEDDTTPIDFLDDDFFEASKQGHLREVLENASAGRLLESVPASIERTETIGTSQSSNASGTFAQDPELMVDFVVESGEHFAVIEEHLLLLEREPDAAESIHAVFRAFHTIKGLAGFLELHGVRNVAHEVETLLDKVRNKKLEITPKIVDLILESTDYLKDEVAAVHAASHGLPLPPIRSNKSILEELSRVLSMEDVRAAAVSRDSREPWNPAAESIQASREAIDSISQAVPVVARQHQEEDYTERTALASTSSNPSPEVPESEGTFTDRRKADKGSIRVETAKLDQLMDMVGEMVIAQTILSHNPAVKAARDARLEGDLLQLTRITGEVQRSAMIMRMTPISGLFQKTARLVRDLSRRAAKNVVFEMSGEQTELDKTIAEELSDPLLHMVRNALDHGIEGPAERIAAGKSPEAQLRLFAQHQAGQIVVGISDDGRGLDPSKILKKAVERGLVKADVNLSDKEIYQLIFEPGFSTAEKITDISGRGVGMDVVRKHVEKLRGRIEITSAINKGTTFFLHLPLTLAVIEGLVVLVGDHRYIIPIFSIQELMRPTAEILFTVKGRDEMVLIRGELLPMVRLHRRLGITPKTLDPCEGLLIIAEAGTRRFALFVDDLIGRQEVVIKSLGDTFKQNTSLAGCAVLGDGRVGLILDMDGLYHSRSY
jgi:two-component system, chemotaxis family, sensor kinase CheA